MNALTCIVVGMQWGDEAKGKLVYVLSRMMQQWRLERDKNAYCVRFGGGENAGHTVFVTEQEKRVFHQAPTGMLCGSTGVLTDGCFVEVSHLLKEITEDHRLKQFQLAISRRATIVVPWDLDLDAFYEQCRNGGVGTTGKGIGPNAASRYLRTNPLIGLLEHPDDFRQAVAVSYRAAEPILERMNRSYDPDEVAGSLLGLHDRVLSSIRDTRTYLRWVVDKGDPIIFEGAQGTMLDPFSGTYPYVSAGFSTVPGAVLSTGLEESQFGTRIGVAKAYTTRVGAGPFPTEDFGALGEHLQKVGVEYGSTTGRARRCGPLDLEILKYAKEVNRLQAMVLTKLDVLDGLGTIPICVGYTKAGRRLWQTLSTLSADYSVLEPVYQELRGWDHPVAGLRKKDELSKTALAYIDFVQHEVGVPIVAVGTGPLVDDLIFLDEEFEKRYRTS